jgi:hypothetical protein
MEMLMEHKCCQVCKEKSTGNIHSIYSRTQKLIFEGESKILNVLYELHEMNFCGADCAEAMAEAMTEGLHPLYQPLNEIATCCECRKPVFRLQPHYALYIGEFEDVSQPWLASMRIVDEEEIAVFCLECRKPSEDKAETPELLESGEKNGCVAGADEVGVFALF